MRWISFSVITLLLSFMTKAHTLFCNNVLTECLKPTDSWTRCYEDSIGSCSQSRIIDPNFFYGRVERTQEAHVEIGNLRVQIPSSALKMSQGNMQDEYVRLVVTVLNSTLFELGPTPTEPTLNSSFILGKSVLVVKAGIQKVRNLSQPVKLLFKNQKEQNGICVFWKDSDVPEETGHWSTDGCSTAYNGTDYICSCNHLSFFAVLVQHVKKAVTGGTKAWKWYYKTTVSTYFGIGLTFLSHTKKGVRQERPRRTSKNPEISVDEKNALNLSYISYIGSAFSVVFTLISIFLYICLHRRRPEKAHGIHIQLAGAMLCLHLSFLVCALLLRYHPKISEGGLCKAFGLILHWSLLATFTWSALEGFHLYLLLVRVFNIYVRRYILKISLFGWGFPTLVAAVCGIANVYGKYTLNIIDAVNQTSEGQMCWIGSHFPHSLIVSYVTTVAYPCLVILYNGGMLGMVVCQLWGLRRADYNMEGSGSWKKKEKISRLWKDSVTVLGLSCVLGIPWGLASLTYISLPGIYVFTVFNALQGFLMFLWCLALRSKSKSETTSSVRDQSSQKMIDTSL